jgi:hypothetical protein
MPVKKYLLAALVLAFFSACLPSARRGVPPAPKKAPAARISPENEKRVESLYYRAVGAYSNGDMKAAGEYIDQISALDPSYRPAAELREKIRKVDSR